MNLDTFKKIQKQVADLEKTGVKFDISIQGDRPWEKGFALTTFQPTFYEVTTLGQLSQLQQLLGQSIKINGIDAYGTLNSKVTLKDIKLVKTIANLGETITDERAFMTMRKDLPSLRYYSPNLRAITNFSPTIITHDPIEQLEDGVSYRYVGTPESCEICAPHTSPLYVYLDRGFTYAKVNKPNEKDKLVITNELTPDTYLVMLLTYLQPAYTKQLENECFINFNKAKLFRVKFEKELRPENKDMYERIKTTLLKDYEKSVNSNMILKVVKGELPIATYNRIKISKHSANYEGVTIEAPELMPFLNEVMIFDDRTDIYTIIQSYITAKLDELDKMAFPAIAEGETEATVSFAFKVNGMDIEVSRTTANTRRSINKFHINKEELSEVCFRSSCFTDQETYNKFIKSVHSMSLKWHDAIGNGIPVKIHDQLTTEEYKQATPTTCPRIKFSKEEDNVYLITGDKADERAPIKLNMCMGKIATMNKRTNNKYSQEYGYTPRNAAWARRTLAKILKECCTFDRKTLVVDDEGNAVLDAEGKKQYNHSKECMLSDEKASFIGKMAQRYYDEAIKRSSLFLAEAVKRTGAKPITFQGSDCWFVEGTLHKYAICKKTNQVYNFDTGHSICIVSEGHRVEVGFDATACRILAVKNDQFRAREIGTLTRA